VWQEEERNGGESTEIVTLVKSWELCGKLADSTRRGCESGGNHGRGGRDSFAHGNGPPGPEAIARRGMGSYAVSPLSLGEVEENGGKGDPNRVSLAGNASWGGAPLRNVNVSFEQGGKEG